MKKYFLLVIFILFFVKASLANQTKYLNIYNWANYIAPEVITEFEKETGIKIIYDVYDSNYILESKLSVASSSGYDIVFPSALPFLDRQIKIGLYQKIDYSKLKNKKYIDQNINNLLHINGELDLYAIPYSWNSTVIGYNKDELNKRVPKEYLDSWAMIFEPSILEKIAPCGIEIIDSPMELVSLLLAYYGKDSQSKNLEDLKFASQKLEKIRPFIKSINSSAHIDNLVNGETCLIVSFSGDIIQAKKRAIESGSNIDIRLSYPKEVNEVGIDTIAILKNAPNLENAYRFIDFLLKPEIAAKITNFTSYPIANNKSYKYLDKEIINDKDILLDIKDLKNYFLNSAATPQYEKARTRIWLQFIKGN